MPESVVVAVIAFGGTVVGTFGGILASTKLTNYRLEQLEKKVDKHNDLVTRTYKLEECSSILVERVGRIDQRLSKVEEAGR